MKSMPRDRPGQFLSLSLMASLGPWTAAFAQRAVPPRDLGVIESADARFRVEVIADSLALPVGLAFLPNGQILVAERSAGRLSLLDPVAVTLTPLRDMPPIHREGDGGLLDVYVSPDSAGIGWIYFAYAIRTDSVNTTVVDRARLDGHRLVDRQRLFEARPFLPGDDHFGGRLMLHGGYLFVSVGDRQHRDLAQDLGTHIGKIIRLHEDGRVPENNPFAGRFVGRSAALPEVWSYGHRNPQGLALHPQTGELWEHEHGPRGGDEVNIIRPGRNYGWPVISYGREYSGAPIGEGLALRDGMEQPVYFYVLSIGPSGMDFYTGDAFPAWKGSLFLGALAHRHLNRLVPNREGRWVREERLLQDRRWRVRVVRQGPDGFLYLGVDEGYLLRLRP